MRGVQALAATLSILVLAGCGSSKPNWAAWATQSETNRQSWETFGPNFTSRNDCLHAFGFQVSHDGYLIKKPFDCIFMNDNLVMMIAVNEFYHVRGVKCIVRFYHPDPIEYDIILKADPDTETMARCSRAAASVQAHVAEFWLPETEVAESECEIPADRIQYRQQPGGVAVGGESLKTGSTAMASCFWSRSVRWARGRNVTFRVDVLQSRILAYHDEPDQLESSRRTSKPR
jgi:hypothetical protein